MADAIIDIVGQEDLPTIVDLYNRVFRPPHDLEALRRRLDARFNVLSMIARVGNQPIGFFLGFESKPTTYFAWFYGVLPEYRRQGIASQLMEAVHDWARENEYQSIRLECHNAARPMLHLAIHHGYDITGIRWEPDHGDNLVIFERVFERE